MTNEQIIERYEGLEVSKSLSMIMDDLPRDTQLHIMELIYETRNKAQAMLDEGATATELMQSVYLAMDERLAEKVADSSYEVKCKKGCAFCCKIQVSITDHEAKAIWDYVLDNGIDVDVNRLEQQKGLDEKTWPFSGKLSACEFLQPDNSCGIYPVRPMNCRKYLVISDPMQCDAEKYFHNNVMVAADNIAEIIFSGVFSTTKNIGNLPTIMLETQPKKV